MKRLVCEICGGTELRKQDGVFVCQSCGCQYTVEEAKKIMVEGVVQVEGTVRVDETNRITNLVSNIKRTFDNQKNSETYTLCSELLRIDPKNPEALIYGALSDGWQITYGNVSHVVDVQGSLMEALKVAYSRYGDTLDYGSLATTAIIQFRAIADGCLGLCNNAFQNAVNNSDDFIARNKNAGYLGSDHIDWVLKMGNEYVQEVAQTEQLKNAMIKAVVAGIVLLEDAAMEPVKSSEAFSMEMLNQISHGVTGPAAQRVCAAFKKEISEREAAEKKRQAGEYWAAHPEEEMELRARYESLKEEIDSTSMEMVQVRKEISQIKARIYITDSTPKQIKDNEELVGKMIKELASLGMFKGKQKKELQERIDSERKKIAELEKAYEAEMDRRDRQFKEESAKFSERYSELDAKKRALNKEKLEIGAKLASANSTVEPSTKPSEFEDVPIALEPVTVNGVDVVLEDFGESKIAVIKVYRELTGIGLKEAKETVESAPTTIAKSIALEKAEWLKRRFEKVGARVRLD